MNGLWASLGALALASALVPIQVVVTLLLLARPQGRRIAVAWVAGMVSVQLIQGVLFGLVFNASKEPADTSGGPGLIVSTLFLIMGVLFAVTALRTAVSGGDPDAPAPKWMAMVDKVTPGRAFLLGAVATAVATKLWVFVIGATATIHEAQLGLVGGTLAFLAFVAAAEILHLLALGTAFLAPRRSASTLAAMTTWLRAHNDQLVIVLGGVFGLWFLAKALSGYGVF